MQDKTKFFLILFILVGVMCFAQTPPTPEGRSGPPVPPAPIDGGLVILIAAGAFYGVKKSLKH